MKLARCPRCQAWIAHSDIKQGQRQWSLVEPVVFSCNQCGEQLRYTRLALVLGWALILSCLGYVFSSADFPWLPLGVLVVFGITARAGLGFESCESHP